MVFSIGKQMHFRRGATGIRVDAHRLFLDGRRGACGVGLGNMGKNRHTGLGHALLQQEVGGPHHRICHKTALHRPVQQQVGESQKAHALMMSHKLPHGDTRQAARHTGGRVIDRFIETVRAGLAFGGQPFQVAASRFGATIRARTVA